MSKTATGVTVVGSASRAKADEQRDNPNDATIQIDAKLGDLR